MDKKQRIAQYLKEFLTLNEVNVIINNCHINDKASYLDNQLNIRVLEIDKDKILIEISNNSKDGFSEFKKEYKF